MQFDNDYVRVVRVHYDAGAKLPDHTHPAGTTVYVYLNDSEGVTFSHSGNINRTVTRPPVKAGAVRIAAGPEEHHTAENPASTPSDFLRIWFKTDNGGERNLRRRLSPTDDRIRQQADAHHAPDRRAGHSRSRSRRRRSSRRCSCRGHRARRGGSIAGQKESLTTAGQFLRLDFLTRPQL